jgi:hypothetical protein
MPEQLLSTRLGTVRPGTKEHMSEAMCGDAAVMVP